MNINPFIDLIEAILRIYSTLLLVYIVITWLIYFEVLNRYNKTLNKIIDFLYSITEPVLSRIRRFIPIFNGIDLSPLVLYLLINFAISLLKNYLYV